MNRIDAKFAELRERRQKAFIAYICAGDPSLKSTAVLARELERTGVDILELGVPFSDPLADGIVNQMAAERALRSGTTLDGVLGMVAGLRRNGVEIPIVFYIYFNLIHRHGVKRFVADAAASGVDGVLALDLPPEEANGYEATMSRAGVHPIYLVAPTTPESRVKEIVKHARGFVYYVSREGVTGMQSSIAGNIGVMVRTIHKHTKTPVAIGFGISTPAQASEVAACGDGVVVGSAIVKQIEKHGRKESMPKTVARFVRPMVDAVKRGGTR